MSTTSSTNAALSDAPVQHVTPSPRQSLLDQYQTVRQFTQTLVAPLAPEDCVIQTMTETSPTKWHLAHTTWFFERFILQDHIPNYTPFCEPYYYLFNSYYNTIGPQHCRPNRGLLSRPTVDEVYNYRHEIDQRLEAFITDCDNATFETIAPLVMLGTQHEQQHQELIITDIKHTLSTNPLLPAMHDRHEPAYHDANAALPLDWLEIEAGVYEVGLDVEDQNQNIRATNFRGRGFRGFDNEGPRHRVFLERFRLARRPVTNREFLFFIEEGGYKQSEHWLSMGWATVHEHGWQHPIYWYRNEADQWMQYTLWGPRPLAMDEPVCHISYFEADAYARWAGCRLPTEFEWEAVGQRVLEQSPGALDQGHFADRLALHPRDLKTGDTSTSMAQLFGDIWEWTSSSYGPYPGFRPLPGALGEYNGKFMCNQYVLRGGSCATPADHLRVSYRNFFPPESRWQFAGLRLAQSV